MRLEVAVEDPEVCRQSKGENAPKDGCMPKALSLSLSVQRAYIHEGWNVREGWEYHHYYTPCKRHHRHSDKKGRVSVRVLSSGTNASHIPQSFLRSPF